MQNPDLYYFVVTLHGQVILDGRNWPNAGRLLRWDDDCGACVPYVRLPESPAGDDPYTEYDLSSGDAIDPHEVELAGTSTYWPTLQDWLDETNGVPGTVEVDDADHVVRFTYP